MKIVSAESVAARHRAQKIVLVASRRTDMPRFHCDEIITGLNGGMFHPQPLMNPMYRFTFTHEQIHSVGLWTQDGSVWIKKRGEVTRPYHYWYRFTVLPDDPCIKPKAPPVDEQLRQIRELAGVDGPRAITVCIDPLCRYRAAGSSSWTDPFTADFFERVLSGCAVAGITRVTVSVIDFYRKVENRARRYGIEFYYPDKKNPEGAGDIIGMAAPLKSAAQRHGITLYSCCEPALVEAGAALKGSCVDGALLNTLFGPGASGEQDRGQRKQGGCGCTLSLDVGRYTENGPWSHHCGHDCPQCYARR
ncbi:MAG TPA: DUF1848 family protein [Spirochaetota bacterium]|nr:DUF1848 family protein [Spirochaetota bacterium]HPI88512.1 DUF1848 family protein [Spirochaetota bacterium]HPR47992.1 DUF1848 family protein [Spirochaetota bacterium]